MAALDLSRAKSIPQKEKDLINGFIRRIQAIFPKHTTYFNIPTSINLICALFYNLYVNDRWDPKHIGVYHKLTNNSYSIDHYKDGWQSSSFGSVIVKSPGIYRWRFKISQLAHTSVQYDMYWSVVLGVWKIKSARKPPSNTYFANTGKKVGYNLWGYAYDTTTGVLIGSKGTNADGPKYGQKCRKGDIIEIELDLNEFTLRYIINDKDMGISHKDIEDTEYRVALSTCEKGAIVKMLR